MTSVPRLIVRHVLLVLLGCGSVWAQFVYRVPSRFMGLVLIVVCSVLSGLQLGLLISILSRAWAGTSPWRRAADAADRVTSMFVLAFGFYGVFLLFNGVLDQARPTAYRSDLLALGGNESDLLASVPFLWADLSPWHPGRPVERLLLTSAEREVFWSAGQRVVVSERPGYFGVRWISAIEIDQEWRVARILASRPSATIPWRDLAVFHVRHRRYPEALQAATQYLQRQPRDYRAAVWMATAFFNDNQFPEVRDVLEPIVHQHRERNTYLLYGTALSRTGRAPEGIRWLERALELDPDFWFTYHLIGVAWTYAGDYRAAIPRFEEAIRRGGSWDMTETEYALQVAREMARHQPARPSPPAR
jgi:tetratricopeptide (TPR) repeat protein